MRSTLLVIAFIVLTPLILVGLILLTDSATWPSLALLPMLYFGYRLYENSFRSKVETGYLGNEEDFIDSILKLASLMIKIQGHIEKSSLNWVEKELKDDFKSPYAEEYFQIFLGHLERDISFEHLVKKVNQEFDTAGKIQLLNFLVQICAIDRVLSEKEYSFLRHVLKSFKLNERILNSLLSMHKLKTKTFRHNSETRHRKRRAIFSIQEAYQILGISESSSNRVVKKAYRKLAMIHHPDKVAHLGEDVRQKAVVNFQKIADAYEIIKNKRGFT